MAALVRIIYASTATHDFSKKELADLLTLARKENAKINISGMLLYTDRSFFQILEGPTDAVNNLFTKTAQDKRHSNVITIIKERIAIRSFADWSMGFANVTHQDLESMTGLNAFFKKGTCFNQLDHDRVKKLLSGF